MPELAILSSMNTRKHIALSIVCVLCAAHCAMSSGFYIVKVMDSFKETEMTIISMEEYKVLNNRIMTERMYHMRAVQLAEAKWKAKYPSHRYPGRQLASRTIKVLHRATTRDRAQKQIEYMKQFKINVNTQSNNGGNYNHGNNHNKHGNNNWQQEKKRKEEERKRKKEEKKAYLSRAYNLYAEALNGMISEKYPDMQAALETVEEKGALPSNKGSERTVKRIGTGGTSSLMTGGSLTSGSTSLSKGGSKR